MEEQMTLHELCGDAGKSEKHYCDVEIQDIFIKRFTDVHG